MSFRHEYIIGDLQGCYDAFLRLLDEIKFDYKQDKIWLAGDLVARGENSLSCLRHVKYLNEKGCLETVLGNHDINLIAIWRGFGKFKKKDNIGAIFTARDCDELLNWLRRQPLLLRPTEDSLLVHAGIPPHWTSKQAESYANEVSLALQSDLNQLDTILPRLYKKTVDVWSNNLNDCNLRQHNADKIDKLRAITNYLTRMRLCDKNGLLEFDFKSSLDDTMPQGYRPWFAWETQLTQRVYFGHWAGLEAKVDTKQVRSTDAGCVWGGRLLAYRLNDNKVFAVDA